jgi:hypothetical protein
VLDRYRQGDRLTDDELNMLHAKMQHLSDVSSEFGDIFTLQRAYAQKVADDCLDYKNSRAERAAKLKNLVDPSKDMHRGDADTD